MASFKNVLAGSAPAPEPNKPAAAKNAAPDEAAAPAKKATKAAPAKPAAKKAAAPKK